MESELIASLESKLQQKERETSTLHQEYYNATCQVKELLNTIEKLRNDKQNIEQESSSMMIEWNTKINTLKEMNSINLHSLQSRINIVLYFFPFNNCQSLKLQSINQNVVFCLFLFCVCYY